MAKRAEIVAILERLRCAYPQVPSLSEETIGIYSEALREFPAEVLAKAAMSLVKTSKWFPAVAEIHELCRGELRRRRALDWRRPALPGEPPLLSWSAPQVRRLISGIAGNAQSNGTGVVAAALSEAEFVARKRALLEAVK